MRIIDRYLLREFLGYLALGLFTFVGIFVIVDVFEKVDTFVDGEASVALVARYYASYIPFVSAQVLPVAMLLASLMALGRFVRQHELTATLMAGNSLWRVFAPVLLFAAAVSALDFGLENGVVPYANYTRNQILNYDIKKKVRPASERERNVRFIGDGGRIYIIGVYDASRAIMRDVDIQEFENDLLHRRILARIGLWKEDHWQLEGVTIRTFHGDSLAVSRMSRLELFVPERPRDFARERRETDEMGWLELWRWIHRQERSGADVTQHLVDLHMKFAIPVTNFITVLIGAALSTRVRRGGMAIGFGLSLLISFIYFSALRAGQALGHGGALPPPLAAWVANLLFGAIGLVLFLRAHFR